MRHAKFILALVLLAGCRMVTEGGQPLDESSSSGDAPDTTAAAEDEGSSDGPDDDPTTESSGSSEGDDDAESGGESEGTTGEAVADYALRFDGSSIARKTSNGGAYGWTATDFTVEAWIEIADVEATGAIFDAQTETFDAGWSLYLHPDWHALVFSFFDDEGSNQLAIGPAVADIGLGWHHIAATKEGDRVFLHVDGVAVEIADVSAGVETGLAVIMTIGSVANEAPLYTLRSVALDDLRITEVPLYSANFDPPVVLDGDFDSGTRLLLHFDEGEGVVTGDPDVSNIDFGIDSIGSPNWVPGHE